MVSVKACPGTRLQNYNENVPLLYLSSHNHLFLFRIFYWFFVNFTTCTQTLLISLFPRTHPLSLHLPIPLNLTEATVCPSGFHSIPFCPHIFTSLSHWSCLRPLASATSSILNLYQDSGCCSVSWRSCSFGSVGLGPSCAPAVH
jgi:hypothetical protein